MNDSGFTVGSLYTGLGGIDLGLERSGMQIKWQCEINPYRQSVLRLRWPGLRLYPNVIDLEGPESVDVVCGGFPCQDISNAGNRKGIGGPRSRMWFEMLRIIGEVRPKYVLVENVSALVARGLDVVLGGLSSIGYDAEWECIPASAVGSPQIRERCYIVAYPHDDRSPKNVFQQGRFELVRQNLSEGSRQAQRGWLQREPPVPGMVDGVPDRLERLKALGDTVVPEVIEVIGRLIIECERESMTSS